MTEATETTESPRWRMTISDDEAVILLHLLRAPNHRCSIRITREQVRLTKAGVPFVVLGGLADASASLSDRELIKVRIWRKSRRGVIELSGDSMFALVSVFATLREKSRLQLT